MTKPLFVCQYSTFGFNIPDASIISVVVKLKVVVSFGLQGYTVRVAVSPDGGASFLTTTQTTPGLTTAQTTYSIDVSNWKTPWTPSDINNICVKVSNGNGNSVTVQLDVITIEVTYDANQNVVPEYALGGLGALAISFVALAVFMKRSSISGFKRQ